jgi:Tol biopolymer transport system component
VPRVSYTPLTQDGLRKEGPLLTDGNRIYFHLQTPDGLRLVSIPAGGGDATPVSTPLGDSVRALDIASDRRSLLLIKQDTVASAWPAWQWEIGTPTAHQVSDLPVEVAAWQPNGETILLAAGGHLTLIRSGTPAASIRVPGLAGRIRWSPSGRTARIFVRDPKTEQLSTWEMDSTGVAHPLKPIGVGNNGTRGGTWTSDERFFIFEINPSGELGWQREGTVAIGRSSKGSGVLTNGGQTWSWPARGSSQNRILALGKKQRAELVRFGSGGSFEPFLKGIPAMELDFSRDGRQLVYTKFPDYTLWIARPDGTDARQLTDAAIECRQPHFSPDGRTVAFIGQRPNDVWRIYSTPTGVSHPELMVAEKEDQGVPTWSADGKYLVFGDWLNRKGGNAMALHRLDVEKKTVTILPGSLA